MPTSFRPYRIDEAHFAIESSFADDSINIFTGRTPEFENTSLVITRARTESSELHLYVADQLNVMSSSYPEYRLRSIGDVIVAGIGCQEVVFSWRGDRGLLYQWQLYIPLADLILIATFTALDRVTEVHREATRTFLESFTLA